MTHRFRNTALNVGIYVPNYMVLHPRRLPSRIGMVMVLMCVKMGSLTPKNSKSTANSTL